MPKRMGLLSLPLVVVIAVIIAIATSLKKNRSPLPPSSQELVIEQAMQGIEMKRFDKNGLLIQVIELDAWLYYPAQAYSQLQKPRLKINQPNGDVWLLSAAEGRASPEMTKIEQLELSGEVNIIAQPKQQPSWQLKTEALTFFPQQMLAHNQIAVTIEGPGAHIEGVGMQADLQNHQIELLKQVTSRYVLSHF